MEQDSSRRLKTVIHVHTDYSFDSNASPRDVVATARRRGVDWLAITDHDELRGALEARDLGIVRVIVGTEVSTADGHLIGLFVERPIPPRLPALETARRIRDQGGLVLAPHPYLLFGGGARLGHRLDDLHGCLDAVEVCNAQNPLWWTDTQAARYVARHGLLPYVGADAHLRGCLDACYQLMPDFDGPAGFKAALAQADLYFGRFGPGYVAVMLAQHVWSSVCARPLGRFGVNFHAAAKTSPVA